MNNYELWKKGLHKDLLEQKDPDFLQWVANYNIFPESEWTKKFLLVGRLKRTMWDRMGKRVFRWCPLIELRMPLGCKAMCKYCPGAKRLDIIKKDLYINTKESLLEAIEVLEFPETISLCAEWGDPGLHPEIINAINKRIKDEWLITKYTYLTNLASKEAIFDALPYTRSLLIHFTMAEPSHAKKIMGYKKEDIFEEIYNNIKMVGALRAQKKHYAKIGIVYIVEPSTIPFIAEHYKLFKDLDGLFSCVYKAGWGLENKLKDDPELLKQKNIIAELKGKVKYEWRL